MDGTETEVESKNEPIIESKDEPKSEPKAEPKSEPRKVNKGMIVQYINRYTIFKLDGGGYDEDTGKEGFYNIAIVGSLVTAITLVALIVFAILQNRLQECQPLNAVIAVGLPMLLYGFATIGGFGKIMDRVFPKQKCGEGLGVAAVAGTILFICFMFGMYFMLGAIFTIVAMPVVELCAIQAMVTAAVFSCNDSNGYTGYVKAKDMAISFVILAIVAVVLICLLMVLMGYFDVVMIAAGIVVLIFATALGFILAKLADIKLGGMDEDVMMASFEFSKPFIILFTIIIALFVM